MTMSVEAIERSFLDELRELALDLDEGYSEWVAASTRIDLNSLQFTSETALKEWLAIPEGITASLRALCDCITKGEEPITVEWGAFRRVLLATIHRHVVELDDWRYKLRTR
jgi:hypothetical protein